MRPRLSNQLLPFEVAILAGFRERLRRPQAFNQLVFNVKNENKGAILKRGTSPPTILLRLMASFSYNDVFA
jgi:hypothetical protein